MWLELVVVWWRVVGVGGDMVECGWSWWGDAEKGMKLMVSVKRWLKLVEVEEAYVEK